jgi:hypothetical protein
MSGRVTVRTDAAMAEDLEVLAAAGWSQTEAVRYALRILADAHRGGMEVGYIQPGQRVDAVATTLDKPVWGDEARRLGAELRRSLA